jgi:uncharacterized protein YkwD
MKFHKKYYVVPVLLGLIVTTLLVLSPANTSAAVNTSAVRLINKTRYSRGLRKLTVDSKLNSSAKAKCVDMVKYKYWSHSNPRGRTWHSFITARTSYRYMGEILGRGYGRNWELQHRDWLRSNTHRSVIVGNYTRFGSYTCEYKSGTKLTVVHFGRR